MGNTETIERLKIIAKDGNMPHVIISGMPGIGKTTSVLCLARQLLGDAYKEAVLELNASDERGTVLQFCITVETVVLMAQVSMWCGIELKVLRRKRSRCRLVDTSWLSLMKRIGTIYLGLNHYVVVYIDRCLV